MNFLTLAAILSLAASATQQEPPAAIPASNSDTAKIYEGFLGAWNGKEHDPINVSQSADLPTPQEVKDFSECVKQGDRKDVEWAKASPIADLSSTIGHLDYVKFVDPKTWHPKDPGDLISKGQSVESAVDAGFSAGLLTLSAITFDKAHVTAAFTYSFVCGQLCGNGGALIFARTPQGWVQAKNSCGNWISEKGKGSRGKFALGV